MAKLKTASLKIIGTTGNKPMQLLIGSFLMMLCSYSSSAQESQLSTSDQILISKLNAAPDMTYTATQSNQMELVIWFMGSKQRTPATEGSESNFSAKKCFINSGMKPNRTLSKSFMKKAVNYDSTIS